MEEEEGCRSLSSSVLLLSDLDVDAAAAITAVVAKRLCSRDSRGRGRRRRRRTASSSVVDVVIDVDAFAIDFDSAPVANRAIPPALARIADLQSRLVGRQRASRGVDAAGAVERAPATASSGIGNVFCDVGAAPRSTIFFHFRFLALSREQAGVLSRSCSRLFPLLPDVSLRHALSRPGQEPRQHQRSKRRHRVRDPGFGRRSVESAKPSSSIVGGQHQWFRLRRVAVLRRGADEGPPAVRFFAADRGGGVCLG